MNKEKISFIIPCYGSEKTIANVIDEIVAVVNNDGRYEYEIITVVDVSPDNVWDVVVEMAKDNEHIKPALLAKNMNRPGASMAGFNLASGDICVLLDDDGQCPVDRVFDLIEPIEEGHDAVYAKYPVKKQSGFKNWGSNLNKHMSEVLIGKPKELQVSNFCAIKAYVIQEMIKYDLPYPYLSGLLLRATEDVVNVEMEERERAHGDSTFTLKKLISLWMNGFTAFSVKPLRVATLMGSGFALLGFIFGIVTIIRKIMLPEIAMGYSSTIALIALIGGMIMLMLGMIGEYVGRIYISLNRSPQFVLKEKVNFDCEKKGRNIK